MNASDWNFFRWQAIKAVGLEGHPRADEAWSLAIKHGHIGQLDEILAHLFDIAEMILEET